LASLLGYCVSELSSVALILVVVWAFHAIDGWTLRPLVLLMGLSAVIRGIRATFAGSVLTIPAMIQDGSFDVLLVRPVHPLIQALIQPGSYSVGVDSLVAVPAFLVVLWYSHLLGSVVGLLVVVLTVLGGVLMFLAVDIALASQALWSGQSVEGGQMHWTLMYIQGQYSQYPLSVFPKLIRWVMTYLFPFAFISYFPVRLVDSKVPSYPLPLWYGWLTLPIGIMMIVLALTIWNRGMYHYQSTGS
jgi:ABC-2 type transport system permease protein